MTIIGAVLSYLFLDPPWRYVVIGALLLTDVVQIMVWLKWRKRKAMTGEDGLIGKVGRVSTECRPEGVVHVAGTFWKAICPEGADEGDEVVVTAVNGLRVSVARR